eukprot:1338707-Rhodomonas_salina.2
MIMISDTRGYPGYPGTRRGQFPLLLSLLRVGTANIMMIGQLSAGRGRLTKPPPRLNKLALVLDQFKFLPALPVTVGPEPETLTASATASRTILFW